MDTLYQGEKIASVIGKIREIFRERFYISIAEIATLADSQSLAFRAVEEMNVQKTRVINRFGQNVYVYFDKKGAYISPLSIVRSTGADGRTPAEVHPVEYSHYITSVNITPLDELISQPVRIPDMIEKIMTNTTPVTGTMETDQALLDRFKFFIRREIVNKAEVLEHVRVRGDGYKRELITGTAIYWINFSGKLLKHGEIKAFEGDVGIVRAPTGMTIPTTTTSSTEGEGGGTWSYPDRYLGRVLNKIYRKMMIDRFHPYEEQYKYFGVTNPIETDILRIAEANKDNAKNPGKVCVSWKRDELSSIANYLGLDNLGDESKFVNDWCRLLTKEFQKRDMLLVL
jgi:hypothetical protein